MHYVIYYAMLSASGILKESVKYEDDACYLAAKFAGNCSRGFATVYKAEKGEPIVPLVEIATYKGSDFDT